MCEQKIPLQPGNVYGEWWNPIDIEKQINHEDRRCAQGKNDDKASWQRLPSVPNKGKQMQVPGPSTAKPKGDYAGVSLDIPEKQMAKLA
jgi:hypothetical protein